MAHQLELAKLNYDIAVAVGDKSFESMAFQNSEKFNPKYFQPDRMTGMNYAANEFWMNSHVFHHESSVS